MAARLCNAFDIRNEIKQKVLYENEVKAERFGFEITRISIELEKISGGRFEYNEDCYVIDISSEEETESIGNKLSEKLKGFPFLIYEKEGERFLAVCPYDQGGRSIEDKLDDVYEIID